MHSPTTASAQPSGPRVRPLELALAGAGWLFISASLAYLGATTPVVERLLLSGQLAAGSGLVRLVALVCLALVPAGLACAGVARMATAVRAMAGHPTAARQAIRGLDPDLSVVGPARLAEGRSLPELIVGWHGIVVCREIPNDARVRPFGGRWEIEIDGTWLPFENPLERTVRDAEALRRHLDSGDRDFVVKVYAVAISPVGMLERVPGCTVLRPEELASYLSSLPRQRSLSSERIRAIARGLGGR